MNGRGCHSDLCVEELRVAGGDKQIVVQGVCIHAVINIMQTTYFQEGLGLI